MEAFCDEKSPKQTLYYCQCLISIEQTLIEHISASGLGYKDK